MSDLAYKISVMQAALEGKKIEYRNAGSDNPWCHYPNEPLVWNWPHVEYRIAPEPRKPREWYVWINQSGEIFPCRGTTGSLPVIRVREVIEE